MDRDSTFGEKYGIGALRLGEIKEFYSGTVTGRASYNYPELRKIALSSKVELDAIRKIKAAWSESAKPYIHADFNELEKRAIRQYIYASQTEQDTRIAQRVLNEWWNNYIKSNMNVSPSS